MLASNTCNMEGFRDAMNEAQLTAGEVTLNYEDRGHPETGAAPLVLLHGYLGSTADWAAVLPRLAERRRVLAYDHRGHGMSGKPGRADAYTFDALTEDLHAFLTGLDLGEVDLLGHSMGGVVAQRYTLAHPERVRSLILMDTAPEPTRGPLSWVVRIVGIVVRRRGMGALGKLVKLLSKEEVGPGGIDREQRDRQTAAFLGMDPEAFAAFGRALGSYPSLVGRLSEISCPTTVLVGARDKTLRSGARQLVDGIADAQLVVIESAGHNPQTEQPAAWLAAVADHFERLENNA